jgi:hypothetical protein
MVSVSNLDLELLCTSNSENAKKRLAVVKQNYHKDNWAGGCYHFD